MRRFIYTLLLATLALITANAQRKTDPLDRGLVAISTSNGVFVSWRQQADEYYNVTYNIYRNGTKLNAEPLTVSNYTDAAGTTASTYTVSAIVDGTEQAQCTAVSVWSNGQYSANGIAGAPNYLTIPMQDIVDRNGDIVFCSCGQHTVSPNVAQTYTLNDASVADIDGDGEVEIIIKRLNASDASSNDSITVNNIKYPLSFNGELYSATNTRAYVILEAYKLDGTRLWWIDCGPNMVSLNSTELNIVAYDWDLDGKSEVVLRGADNMIIHKKDGSTYNVGNMGVNTRSHMNSHTNAQYAWTRTANEYLLYLKGETAEPYSVTEFPLKRLEDSEFSDEIDWTNPDSDKLAAYINAVGTAWGDGYGHRSSKYFFGAPYLDGKKPSIFLARGIYTRHKMIALDVDPTTHNFTTKWTWNCADPSSPWFAQGNHNFSIADVDGDGCDEIIYGSMTIDNNGKGVSTTGLGHGDALHVSDLDPFTKGLEVFACNEDRPANNLRNATTSEIYYRTESSKDDGRALMGNFTNEYPGCFGRSTQSGVISSATHNIVDAYESADNFINWSWLNGRIYWDGDLCEEYVNSPGTERECVVAKPGGNRIMQTSGVKMNNESKNNPCFQGDIIGDWREELILRNAANTELRVYSTTIATDYAMPSLWYDPEYRQAMVWQMCAYNQPPHASFFVGEMEGLTKAPIPLTNTSRTEISPNGSITAADNNSDIMICEAGNVEIPTDISPRNLIINVPSTVSGNDDNDNITYSYGKTQLGTANSGDLTGTMNLAKQGDGLLAIAERNYSYTGNTDVFSGSLSFNGTLLNSPIWMNRHTALYTTGTFNQPVTMEYGSTLHIGNGTANDGGEPETKSYGTADFTTLNLHEGARIIFDIDKEDDLTDQINIGTLSLRTQDWDYAPKYTSPVFEINSTNIISAGTYRLGNISTLDGDIEDIIVEGNNFGIYQTKEIKVKDGVLYLNVTDTDDDIDEPTNEVTGNSTTSKTWDFKSIYAANYNSTAWLNLGNTTTPINETECVNSTSSGTEGLVFQNEENTWRISNAGLRDQSKGTRTMGITGLKKGDIITVVCSVAGEEANVVTVNTTNATTSISGHTYTFTMTTDGNLGLSVARTANSNYYTIESITLTHPYSKLILSPTIIPEYEQGVYDTVTINRSFKIGYSTLCIPFNTTVSEFTDNDSEAYVAYLSDVRENNGTHTLVFTNTDQIKANKPYIIYLSKILSNPTFANKPVFTNEARTITAGLWTMSGNYTPAFSMYGKYGVANNATIMKGGSNSKLNGLSAYIEGPANSAGAKLVFGAIEEDDTPTGVNTVNGSTAQKDGKYAEQNAIIIKHNGKNYRLNGIDAE